MRLARCSAGLPPGYPLILDINLANAQLRKELIYLHDGAYLDRYTTTSFEVRARSQLAVPVWNSGCQQASRSAQPWVAMRCLARVQVRLATYSRDRQVFGTVGMVATWDDAGLITARIDAQALEWREYSTEGLRAKGMPGRLANDLALLVLVLVYVATAAWDIIHSYRVSLSCTAGR